MTSKLCKTCIYYQKLPNDLGRCKRFVMEDMIFRQKQYVETTIARFEDFQLCGKDAKFHIDKETSQHRASLAQKSSYEDRVSYDT